MENRQTPFSAIGKKTRDFLFNDFNIDTKSRVTWRNKKGFITSAGLGRDDQYWLRNISTRIGRNVVDMDVGKDVVARITLEEILPSAQAAISYNFQEKKYGGELSATMGDDEVTFGGEVGFDGASVTKFNVGVGIHVPNDFSAAIIVEDKGQTLKASFTQKLLPSVFKNFPFITIGGEMTRDLVTNNDSFNFAASLPIMPEISLHTPVVDKVKADMFIQQEWKPDHKPTTTTSFAFSLDRFTFKTNLSDTGKEAYLVQQEWRPNSLATFSMELNRNDSAPPKFGFSLAL